MFGRLGFGRLFGAIGNAVAVIYAKFDSNSVKFDSTNIKFDRNN